MMNFFKKMFSTEQEMTPYMTEVTNAANNGNAEAQHCLGLHYKYGNNGFRKNARLAMEWLHKAAEQGYIPAYQALTVAYWKGDICPQSNEQFVKWGSTYLKAVGYNKDSDDELMDEIAKEMGTIYLKGDGVERDFEKADKYFGVPAIKGDAFSQFCLALTVYDEASPIHCPHNAVIWFHKAAEQDYAEAQRMLGLCYLLGEGVETNVDAARYWFTKAAEQGDEKALLALEKYC